MHMLFIQVIPVLFTVPSSHLPWILSTLSDKDEFSPSFSPLQGLSLILIYPLPPPLQVSYAMSPTAPILAMPLLLRLRYLQSLLILGIYICSLSASGRMCCKCCFLSDCTAKI